MKDKVELVPLAPICPTWRKRIIPSAFADLERGIEREAARLRGLPFVILEFRREYDFDGLTEYLELFEGFSDSAAAVVRLEQRAEEALANVLSKPSSGPYRWQLAEWRDTRLYRRPESDSVSTFFSKSFRVINGSGYDSKYFEFEVLHVKSRDVVGSELFSFVNVEWEWVSFLTSRGKDAGGARE